MTWHDRFDRLLKAMASGEAPKRPEKEKGDGPVRNEELNKRTAPKG